MLKGKNLLPLTQFCCAFLFNLELNAIKNVWTQITYIKVHLF